MTTTPIFPPTDKREQLFRLYPQLAGRVTNLRAILQNDGPIPIATAREWADEVCSVYNDFTQLNELTREYVKGHLTEEKPDVNDE